MTSACSLLQGLMPDEPAPKVQSEGFPSAVAEAHQGEVVFSTQEIPRGPTDDSSFSTRFTLDDPIYLRAFMPDSFHNIAADAGVACTSTYPASGGYENGSCPLERQLPSSRWTLEKERSPDLALGVGLFSDLSTAHLGGILGLEGAGGLLDLGVSYVLLHRFVP